MTVIYNASDTWKMISNAHGTVWPAVIRSCIAISALTYILYLLKHEFDVDYTFGSAGHSYFSIMIAFLIVGRAQEAIRRYWMARGEMASALNNCRDLSMIVISTTGRDQSPRANEWRDIVKTRTIRLLRTTMCALSDEGLSIRLMQGDVDERSESVLDKGKVNKEKEEYIVDPMDIAVSLYTILERNDEYLKKPIHFLTLNAMESCIVRFTDKYYSLTKFASTPMPFSVANMGRTLLIVWVVSLPFVLVHEMDEVFACVFGAFFLTYAFVGLECVVIELHDPFGEDPNDIEVYRLTEATVRGVKKDLEGDNIIFSKQHNSEGRSNKFKSNEWRISKWDKGLVFSFNDSDCSTGGEIGTIMKDLENQQSISEADLENQQSISEEESIPVSEVTPLNGTSMSTSSQ